MITEVFDITLESINACNDKQELAEMKVRIELSMVSVKGQIAKAKADIHSGKEIDNEWFARAKSFKNSMGFLHQQLLSKERELNKENKEIEKKDRNSLENNFIDVAREMLSSEQFYTILKEAQTRKNK